MRTSVNTFWDLAGERKAVRMAVLSCGRAQGECRCAVMLDAVLKQKQQGKEETLQGLKDGAMDVSPSSQSASCEGHEY